MTAPDIAEILDQQGAEHGDDADDDGRDTEAQGATVAGYRARLSGAQDGERTHEHETDTQQGPTDAHDRLITMNVERHTSLEFCAKGDFIQECILPENAMIMAAHIGLMVDAF
jgi:hypothetical protein